jgi:hypothetical protein
MDTDELDALTRRIVDWQAQLPRALLARWFASSTIRVAGDDGFDRALAEIPSCVLDEAGRHEQRARYARLATSVARVQRKPEAVVIEFDQTLDPRVLEEALELERGCCPFFRFAFDQRDRRLHVMVADGTMLSALDAIADGFAAAQHTTPNG